MMFQGKSVLLFHLRSSTSIFVTCRNPARVLNLVRSDTAPKTCTRKASSCPLTSSPLVNLIRLMSSSRRRRQVFSTSRSSTTPSVLQTDSASQIFVWRTYFRHNSRTRPRFRFSMDWSKLISIFSCTRSTRSELTHLFVASES